MTNLTLKSMIFLLGLAVVGGCRLDVRQSPRLEIVAAIDFSGSYTETENALRMIRDELIPQLHAGDRLVVRTLESVSHHREGTILQLESEDTLSPGLFYLAAEGELEARDSVVAANVTRAQAALTDAATRGRSNYTDIVGGLAHAAEHLNFEAQSETRGLVLLFTDGIDTGPNAGADVPVDLSGIDVRFLLFEPQAALARKLELEEEWTIRCRDSWGARSVVFVPSGRTLNLEEFRRSVAREG